MNDTNVLLDKFTQILAYVGDEGAKDGYFLNTNNAGNPVYSIPIRSESLSGEELENLVRQIKKLLENNKPLVNIQDDIAKKAQSLKAAFDKVANKNIKNELIDYIGEFEVNPIQGGKRNNRKSSKSKLTVKKSRKNSKTRKSTSTLDVRR